MATLVRWMLCLAWMAGMGWSWQTGVMGGLSAALLAAPALPLLLVRTSRRRRGALQYVQMAKAPVAVP